MPEDSKTPRTARACVNCNKKKIRCRFDHSQTTCGACSSLNIECIARTRKKRKIASRHSSPDGLVIVQQHEGGQAPPYQYWGTGAAPWPGNSEGSSLSRPSPSQAGSTMNWQNHADSPVTKPDTPYGNATRSRYSLPSIHQGQLASAVNTYPEDSRDRKDSMHLRPESSYGSTPAHKAPETEGYMGRSHYIAHDVPIDESGLADYRTLRKDSLSATAQQTLQLYGSFDMPLRAARQSLIDTYMRKCYPWTPILDPTELDNNREKPPSLLLSQSVFLASSRVSAAPGVTAYASSEQFYQRAKALFWTGHEADPLTAIKAAINLHWYNPDGPEHISYDTSTFWLQIAVGLARQAGLNREPTRGNDQLERRRLWWALVARDCLISAGQGRPRSINLKDADLRPPCLEDFPGATAQGELFMSYVEIAIILADLTECCSRKHISQDKRLHTERALFRWTRTLAPHLLLSRKEEGSNRYVLSDYNVKARQLHVPYFITLTILGRSGMTNSNISAVAILASSFVAGICEDFLARDELLYLGPIFTFYLLAAGVALASLRRYPTLWPVAEQDLEVLQASLKELSKRWPSAIGALKALQNVMSATRPAPDTTTIAPPLAWLNADQSLLFDGFCTDICRLWVSYHKETTPPVASHLNGTNSENTEIMTAEILGSMRYPGTARQSRVPTPQMASYSGSAGEPENPLNYEYVGVGNWLLNDWGPEVLWN